VASTSIGKFLHAREGGKGSLGIVSFDSLCPAQEKLRRWQTERYGYQADVFKAYVPFAPLDAAHVAAVQSDPMRELFLAPTSGFAKLTHAIAE